MLRNVCMSSSRLAACIALTAELDGITVIVPDTNDDYTNSNAPLPHPESAHACLPTRKHAS